MNKEKLKTMPKSCCIYCGKEYYTHMINQHLKSCKYKNLNNFIDYVICPICGKRCKEINNFHLKTHNITVKQFEELYKGFNRLSDSARHNKNSYKTGVTPEQSKKLKYSHTLNGYISRYGIEVGTQKYNDSKLKKSKSHYLEWYISKYGEEYGTKKYWDDRNNKGIKLDKYILKYGIEDGKKRYKDIIDKSNFSRTLNGYINKYGYEDGLEKWLKKNNKNSESSRKINKEHKALYLEYCLKVDRITRYSITKYGLVGISDRGKGKKHIDHKVSKLYGFQNNVPYYIIGSIHNLEMIHESENCSKQHNNSIDCSELVLLYENDVDYIEITKIYFDDNINLFKNKT